MKDPTQNPSGKYSGNAVQYILEALDSDNTEHETRPWVQRLEAEFCRTFGVNYAIACNAGTTALHAVLAGAGVSPGDGT
jgi:perosamine synthetase